MKKIIMTALSLMPVLFANAQMTLEKSYVEGRAYVINLETAGKKYAVDHFGLGGADEVRLYNLNHSLYKTIQVPTVPGHTPYYCFYISEGLFNTDSKIELAVMYTTSPYKLLVINENGTVLNSFDNYQQITVYNVGNNTFKAVVRTDSAHIFSLPGKIPCDICGNGLGLGKVLQPDGGGTLGEPVPNPSTNYVDVAYQLPAGTREGQIDVYNTNGQMVKSYRVDENFKSLRLDNTDLVSGVYYYSLRANGATSQAKRMIVMP